MTDNKLIAKAARLAAPIYEANEWTWGGSWSAEEAHIPTSEEIAITLASLVANVRALEPGHSSSTGRLYVSSDEDGEISISVEIAELPAPEGKTSA